MGLALFGVMENERKTVRIQILSGYAPEVVAKSQATYFRAIFAAFWKLAHA